jgi:hypothetical protein
MQQPVPASSLMIAGKQAQSVKNAHWHGRQSELDLAHDKPNDTLWRTVANR